MPDFVLTACGACIAALGRSRVKDGRSLAKRTTMSAGVDALFTSALGFKSPWEVVQVDLDTAKRRIDFEVACNAA